MGSPRVHIFLILVCWLLISGCSPESRDESGAATFSVLTLNLHTYQEVSSGSTPENEITDQQAHQRVLDYGPIFDRIAAGIETLDPDVVCLQEIGEWFADAGAAGEFGAGDSNMVRQILSRLPGQSYEVTMDWSHYGWGVWREGSAVLSKHPIVATESRFISRPENSQHDNWKARNVPRARVDVPGVGLVDVYSVHAGWWDDPEEPSREQFERLLGWVQQNDAATVILCGDFNAPAGGPAYEFLTADSGLADPYLLVNPDGMFDGTIARASDGWEDAESAQRIDYVFVDEASPLEAIAARLVFTPDELGKVSDHAGVFMTFNLERNN